MERADKMIHHKQTSYGFEFGDAKVSRFFSDEKKGWVTLGIESSKYQGNKAIQIYVTKTGKIRIFSNEGEWFPKDKIKDKKEATKTDKQYSRDDYDEIQRPQNKTNG